MRAFERVDPHRRWRALVVLLTLVSIAGIHAPILGYKMFANVDEAYAISIGERLLEGHKLYQGAISQRGPLMYYIFEGIAALHGWDNVVALRVWALGLAFAHVLLVYWAGKVLLSRNAATVAVAISGYALSFGFPPEDAVAINGEPLQLPALLVGIVLGALAVRSAPESSARRMRLLGAGIALGIAASIKQSALLHPIPLFILLLADAQKHKTPVSRVLREASLVVLGTLLVPTLLLVHAAHQGTLRDLIYYCFTYNNEVHMNPSPRHFVWVGFFFIRMVEQTLFILLAVLVIASAWPALSGRLGRAISLRSPWALLHRFGMREYIGLHFVLAVFVACMMYRFFPHYFLQAMPFMALAVGALLEPLFRGRYQRRARLQLSAFVGFVVVCAALGAYYGERIDGRVAHDRTVNDTAKYIEATSNPNDRIFVWGFSPWLYPYSHRKPAGRYVFETYVTGFVPWFWEKLELEKTRIVPGSVDALLADLDREDPALVVDAGSYMMARPMRTYDKPAAWLRDHYCFEVRIGAHDIYRKRNTAECAQKHFPRPHDAIDWRGRTLFVPIPVGVDHATAQLLPRRLYSKPVWFHDGPTPPGLEAIRDRRLEREEAEARASGFWVDSAMDQPE